ncbi:TPA: plasmid pRiA4b ORF-3 family protein [Pseudomonas aeruginosa]|nr:plasmid pRiA4b ORF-3 family protein [Pseudomonas aeruginosa]HCE9730734.1 plasmid pRiA4b ORF-3 family protein [Pseudomonas aeruginosa]HCF1173297.1 plasmid pRiA4b ORF-3 family protein [Pseudomonas aeruginosa]HCF1576538.1 plasmid pRiA4b ORF-3 family protein [Pseudomonas aeruginosa]
MATQPLLYTLHIQLEPLNFNPPVWRRLRVNGDYTLRKLHHFIQAAFGWHSSHLHEFSDGIHRYLPLDAELMYMYDDALDDRKSKLRRVLKEADRLRYLYDFGDSWQHVIAVESIEPCDFTGTWCEVLDGARACPPEDVGGVPGYLDFLASGGSFDPELFDRRAANAAVQRICNNFWG